MRSLTSTSSRRLVPAECGVYLEEYGYIVPCQRYGMYGYYPLVSYRLYRLQ